MCDFCESEKGVILENGENTMLINKDIITWHTPYGSDEYNINYCPVCGKKLAG